MLDRELFPIAQRAGAKGWHRSSHNASGHRWCQWSIPTARLYRC